MTITHQGLAEEDKSLALTREVNLDYAVVRQFSRGDDRIREDIPVPDNLGKEAFLIGE